MALLGELQELMVKYRFKPDKRLSQHFIISPTLIERLVSDAHLSKADIVLEIGAGTGFLTRELVKHCRVIAIEKDPVLFRVLQETILSTQPELRNEDFLDSPLKRGDFNKVVALPPYAISSEIMYKILGLGFESSHLVFQSEFVDKIVALPGFADYNALSVLTQFYCDTKIVCSVEASSFFPKPRGASALLSLEYRKKLPGVSDTEQFSRLVKELFRYKNKTVQNALKLAFPFLQKANGKLKLDPKKADSLRFRTEKIYQLEVEDFVEIDQKMFS